MCGLAGYCNLSNKRFCLDEPLLQAMQKKMVHRGPDGFGIWKSEQHQIGLVHRRLSIIDLSDAGLQPMLDKEQTVVVCFNGEIYNHQILRTELISLGYRYSSQTDTETILYAYKTWGIDFIHRLEGMFAIALFDIQKNELYLIRDRIGIKPLYFSLQDSILSFASEIKALWSLPWVEKKIKPSALYHYLTYLVTPAPMTLYDGIYKLPAGYYLKCDAQRNYSFHQWYDPVIHGQKYDQAFCNDEQFCIDNIRSLLRTSIKKRMMADVPYGVFLSGGIDSSLNVALMAEQTDRVKTFNIAFSDGPEYNEVEWARRVARHFNTEHHEMIISEREAFEFFEKMVYHQDEPIGDCVCVPLYYVSQLLKNSGVTVVQVGEGSDELFCGYDSYARYLKLYRYWKPTQQLVPSIIKKGLYRGASRLFPEKKSRLSLLQNWAENRELFWGGVFLFSELWKKDIVINCFEETEDPVVEKMCKGLHCFDSYNLVTYHRDRLMHRDPQADIFKMMSYLELKHRLPELLLMRVDKMTMATSVEARVPFLDHKLVEFALQMPMHLKYRNGTTKYILKKACEGILPHDIIYRKKVGFAAPTTRWFKHGSYFKVYLRDMLATKKTVWNEYVDCEAIAQMIKDNETGAVDYSYHLWALQNLLACNETK